MRYVAGVVGVVIMLGFGGPAGAGDIKVGFVDLQRALATCGQGKKARERFVGEMDRLQAKLRSEKEDLDRQREEFDKKAMLLRDKERLDMEQGLEDRQLGFKRKYEDYQRDLKRLDAEYTGDILRGLEKTITEIGADGGYTAIFEAQSSGILYGEKGADLTEELIRRYDAGGGSPKKD